MYKFFRTTLLVLLIFGFMVSCGKSGEQKKTEAKAKKPQTTESANKMEKHLSPPEKPYVMAKDPHLVIETDMGNMEMVLYLKESPMTASNFLYLVRQHFYDGLTFHRVIPGFVIQGGDPKGNGTGGPGYMIKFEKNDKKHIPGAVAMARSRDPNSAGSQFYIALQALPHLDGKYCVFGQLVSGLDVAKKIAAVKCDNRDKPLTPIHIIKIYEKKGSATK